MAGPTTYVSVHDQRVALVAAALRANSTLDEKAATKLAGHALDHIPEKVRQLGRRAGPPGPTGPGGP